MSDDDHKILERLGMQLPRSSRTQPSSPPGATAKRAPREKYKAFATQDRQKDALELRRKIGTPSHAVTYHFLHSVTYDRGIWRRVCLTASGLAIEILGRDLALLADSVWNRQCVYVQEYADDEFLPPEPGEAFVEKIIVTVLHGIGAPRDTEDA